VKNQLGYRKLMNLRAISLGIGAAFLALACSSSDDKSPPGDDIDDTDNTPVVNTPPDTGNGNGNGNGSGIDPVVTPPDNSNEEVDVNDLYVESILQTNCGKCHGAAAQAAGPCKAGMCYIEDVQELIANGKIVPGKPEESPLYDRLTRSNGTQMPPPGETQRPSQFEISQIKDFILRKPAAPAQVCNDQFITWDQVYEAIETDILRQDADDREFIRYISLTDRYNAGVCDQDLEADRFAMNKFINSISQNNRVQQAVEVRDAELSKSIYSIDLRDYDLDVDSGPFIVNGVSFADGWQAIVDVNDFAVEFQGDQAENVILQTGEPVPVMFSDTMIDVASFGNTYYGLLQLNDTRDTVQADLLLDLAGDLDQKITVRAGTTTSAISEQERLVQRNEQPVAGLYYYESFDLDPDIAGASILNDPLGFDGDANGSEAVFSLPNGLQAYIIFDQDGNRLEESPILFDNLSQNDNVMRAGVSCMNCHAQGLVPFDDQVRQFSEDNSIDAAAAAAAAGGDFEDILDLYPTNPELQDILSNDSSIYLRSLQASGVPTTEPKEPIASTFITFDKDVNLTRFAGLLHFPERQLEQEINRLDPELGGLDNGLTVDVDNLKALYANSLCVVTVANENRPADQVCIDAGIVQ